MEHNDFLLRLDEMIQERSILKHPFYRAWLDGTLKLEQLATYAEVYYPHVAAFPGYLQAAIGDCQDERVRGEMEANLADELGRPKAHPELWLDFAAGMGLERERAARAEWRPAAQRMVETFDRLARSGSGAALAALYAYESQQPEVAREKAVGLRNRYGVKDERTLAYFDVHAEADLEHRAGEREALGWCLEDGADAEVMLRAADEALEAYWGLLDGICEEAGVRNGGMTVNEI